MPRGTGRGRVRERPREERRITVELPGSPTVHATTRNLGLGGAFIETSTPPKVGTVVAIRLTLPGRPPAAARAEVRWAVAGAGVGVKFHGLELDDLDALARLVAGTA